MEYRKIGLVVLLIIFGVTLKAQDAQLIDKIVAKVGSNIVLKSDIESQYLQYLAQGGKASETGKCGILDNLIIQKLLINQAKLDSLKINEEQVEDEMNRRLRYFISQIGSQEKLEDYLGKSVIEFKAELRDQIRDMLLANQMQQEITKNITITPSEVREYYKSTPKDSLPFINTEVEVAQILRLAKPSTFAKEYAKNKLEELRGRVAKGESFQTLAILYSQDPGSAKQGGELGFVGRGDLVKAFEAVAFKLKPGQLSDVVETEYGFHILQLIERRGEQVNVRHILIKPEVSGKDIAELKSLMDSLYAEIQNKKIEFAQAAEKYSEDKATKSSGGNMVNMQDGSLKIPSDQLDPNIYFIIDTMKVGNVSKPAFFQNQQGEQGYRMVYFRNKTEPHKCNLQDDYQKVQELAQGVKQAKVVEKWYADRLEETYVSVDPDYNDCPNSKSWKKSIN